MRISPRPDCKAPARTITGNFTTETRRTRRKTRTDYPQMTQMNTDYHPAKTTAHRGLCLSPP
ncbi:hypothetical protein JCM14469_04930 [Desulfatiferula olefinivorans]